MSFKEELREMWRDPAGQFLILFEGAGAIIVAVMIIIALTQRFACS